MGCAARGNAGGPKQAYALLECFASISQKGFDQGVQLGWFSGHELNVLQEKLIFQPQPGYPGIAPFHKMGAAWPKKSTTKANMSGALSRKSAQSRSSTKRKALCGFHPTLAVDLISPCACFVSWGSVHAVLSTHATVQTACRLHFTERSYSMHQIQWPCCRRHSGAFVGANIDFKAAHKQGRSALKSMAFYCLLFRKNSLEYGGRFSDSGGQRAGALRQVRGLKSHKAFLREQPAVRTCPRQCLRHVRLSGSLTSPHRPAR